MEMGLKKSYPTREFSGEQAYQKPESDGLLVKSGFFDNYEREIGITLFDHP